MRQIDKRAIAYLSLKDFVSPHEKYDRKVWLVSFLMRQFIAQMSMNWHCSHISLPSDSEGAEPSILAPSSQYRGRKFVSPTAQMMVNAWKLLIYSNVFSFYSVRKCQNKNQRRFLLPHIKIHNKIICNYNN